MMRIICVLNEAHQHKDEFAREQPLNVRVDWVNKWWIHFLQPLAIWTSPSIWTAPYSLRCKRLSTGRPSAAPLCSYPAMHSCTMSYEKTGSWLALNYQSFFTICNILNRFTNVILKESWPTCVPEIAPCALDNLDHPQLWSCTPDPPKR